METLSLEQLENLGVDALCVASRSPEAFLKGRVALLDFTSMADLHSW
ncbi:DUF4351 domain-containing protein [Chlorogloeopsis sp. ULAP01]|nr:DUF4351 domain-containing protein [Chlorogloeopsis sp. ULAP01]MDM9383747.1 DUF4351 domain-containing protein [Chlorogloeopsis sp. ULAP01]